jgi:TonB-dependent starch-binding outer membrane protein SusC
VYAAPGFFYNQPAFVMSRWRQESDVTDIQIFSKSSSAAQAYGRLASSDRTVTDASFIRLKNVSLSWSLPASWSSRIKIRDLRVFVLGQNLLTFTDFKGRDPETSGRALPPLKVVTAGMHISF